MPFSHFNYKYEKNIQIYVCIYIQIYAKYAKVRWDSWDINIHDQRAAKKQ